MIRINALIIAFCTLLFACSSTKNEHKPAPQDASKVEVLAVEEDALAVEEPEAQSELEQAHEQQAYAMLLPLTLSIKASENNIDGAFDIVIEYRSAIASETVLKITLGSGTTLVRGQLVEIVPPQKEATTVKRTIELSGSRINFEAQIKVEDNGMFIEMHESYPAKAVPRAKNNIPSIAAPPNTYEAGIPITETVPVKKK
ncbi:MAG: hypothetical protein WC966_04415 [Bradymonadales bacterium]|jgi:hypothetical protein